jgi:light-regulated signal transduction histidine kinase (bacteriophytochrome)
VSAQIRDRQRVQELNNQLAAINGQLAASNAELGTSNEQLTRTNVDLDNFIYTASHDLNAPSPISKACSTCCRRNCPPRWFRLRRLVRP